MPEYSSKRPLVAEISRDAFRYNLSVAQGYASKSRIMAILKANAYGHGLENILPATDAAHGFGVLTLDAALSIREWEREKPIILLEGFFDAAELAAIADASLTPVIHGDWQIELMERAAMTPASVYLKINTGMNRLGFTPSDIATSYRRIAAIAGVKQVHLMSHLANADDRTDDTSEKQSRCFSQATTGLGGARSLANSAGVCVWPDTHFDWVRPGIMLYGGSPLAARCAEALDLKPVMTLKSRVIAIQELRPGDRVGYGGIGVCTEVCRIAIVACGYGDGYPRHAEQGTPVLVNSIRRPLIGRVSMDMLAVNLGTDTRAMIGDEVVLWGDSLPADEVAHHAGTIAYELFTGVTARVPRKVVD